MIKKEDLVKKVGESSWAKKLASQKRRAELNDFERFQVMMLKRQVRKFSLNTNRKLIWLTRM